jgi:integrase
VFLIFEKGEVLVNVTYKNNTEKRYLYELKKFINSGKDLNKYIKEDIEDRKQLSKFNCGLKMIDFEDKQEVLRDIEKMFRKKNKKKYIKKPEKQLKLRNKENSINRLKNKRLKIAFRLQEISGLRVEELSNLSTDNIFIDQTDNRIIIKVKEGKGGKDRVVKCLPDEWVLDNLMELEHRKNGKLFYSKSYLMQQARQRCNIHTHDLRKAFAVIKYHNNVSGQALEELKEELGHIQDSNTYKKYLNRDINTVNTRWDKMSPIED